MNYDVENIKSETLNKLDKYTSSSDWNSETVKKVSLPCYYLMQWINCVEETAKRNTN